MSAGNGVEVIRIGSKGMKTYAIGDEGQPFTVDVLEVNAKWSELARQFHDEEGKVPPQRVADFNTACWQFVAQLSKTSVTRAEAYEFMKVIGDEARRLSNFFLPEPDPGEPSSPDTSTKLRFST